MSDPTSSIKRKRSNEDDDDDRNNVGGDPICLNKAFNAAATTSGGATTTAAPSTTTTEKTPAKGSSATTAGLVTPAAPASETATETAEEERRPEHVYVVIHDKVVPEEWWNRGYGDSYGKKQDTEILDLCYDRETAEKAALNYVTTEFDLTIGEDGDLTPIDEVEWVGEGWYRTERYSTDKCDDRVYIEKRSVS